MSYIVLARKYRPARFDDVIGQEHITDLLKKAVDTDRLAHAYLFCGPRGIGKTSCARILAKCLNCQEGPTVNPCGTCSACKEIAQGNSFDVLEIDGASNRGIDEIRTIRENVKFAPTYGKYKIYIVDEVHMLTTEAFNALLKTLEEPPEHVKFIFATTDPNKLPATILSRCHRFDFKQIPIKTEVEVLARVAASEKIKISQEALYAIAKAAQGSFRDCLSTLDQISAIRDRDIEGEDVFAMLGIVETELLFGLADSLAACNCAEALKQFDEIINRGKDIKQLAKDLLEHFRHLMIMKVGGKSLGRLLDYPVSIKEMYLKQAQVFSLEAILKSIELLIEAQEVSRVMESQRMALEIAFAKMTYQAQGPSAPMPTGPAVASKPQDQAHASQKEEPKPPFSPAKMLKNRKGEINAREQDTEEALQDQDDVRVIKVPESMTSDEEGLTLHEIQSRWNSLTHALSKKRMSLATYLQEGYPSEFDGQKLKIGFSEEHAFFKETLTDKDNRLLVEQVFSEALDQVVHIYFEISGEDYQKKEEEAPVVQSVLQTFQGKVVKQWHSENDD